MPEASSAVSSRVRVAVRVRPFQPRLDSNNTNPCVERKSPTCIVLRQTSGDTILEQQFPFDKVFMPDAQQEEIFESEVEPLIDSCLDGKNVTILCYGPTGSGKTFSCCGTQTEPGIISRAVACLLDSADEFRGSPRGANCAVSVTASMIEIYNEKVYDLMNGDVSTDLPIRQSSKNEIIIPNLTAVPVASKPDFDGVFNESVKRRRVAFTKLNAHSSRSHFITMLQTVIRTLTQPIQTRTSKLYLVDLAGSENNKRTGNRGMRLTESVNINKSLFNLGHVIECLRKGSNNKPPFRNSKLTRLLQDSLGGTAKSVMICHISPSIKHFATTQKCLSFGSNTRKIVNTVVEHVATEKREVIIVGEEKEPEEVQVESKPSKRKRKSTNRPIPTAKEPKAKTISADAAQKLTEQIEMHSSKFAQMEREIQLLQSQLEVKNNAERLQQDVPETETDVQPEPEIEVETEVEVVQEEDDGFPAPMTPVTNSRMVVDFVTKAKQCERDGELEKAKKYYRRALRLRPGDERIARKIRKVSDKIAAKQQERPESEDAKPDVEMEESNKENVHQQPSYETPVVRNRRSRSRLGAKRTLPTEPAGDRDDEPPRKRAKLCEDAFSSELDSKGRSTVMSWFNDWELSDLQTLVGVGVKTAKQIVSARPYAGLSDMIGKTSISQKRLKKIIDTNKSMLPT